MKAAVLLVRLTKTHVLPDGNKRTALTCMVRFCLRNGYEYVPPAGDEPAGWIAERLRPPPRAVD